MENSNIFMLIFVYSMVKEVLLKFHP